MLFRPEHVARVNTAAKAFCNAVSPDATNAFTTCPRCAHTSPGAPRLELLPLLRYGWRCPECGYEWELR